MSNLRYSRFDKLAEDLRVRLRANRAWIMAFVTGFLIGGFTNILTASEATTFSLLWSSFWKLKPFVVLTTISVVVLIAVPLLGKLLNLHYRHRRYESLLSEFVTSRVSPIVSPFAKGVIAWGPDISLQVAHDLREGWRLDEVEVHYDGTEFEMPNPHIEAYERYFHDNYHAKRFFDDGDKFMLIRNPKTFSDSPTLVLELRKTKYSQVQYYRDNVATIQPQRNPLILNTLSGAIEFPHSLCMHALILTNDNSVLMTQRAPKVDYYPGAWSASIEEQLSSVDLREGNRGSILRWGKRLLLEELSLAENEYNSKNFRVLSVFLEADILNCSLASVFRLMLSSRELNKILEAKPRSDYEFVDWTFLSFHELVSELRRPTRPLHPTSGYRILLSLVKHYGMPRLMKLLFDVRV